ncbi:MAG: hypothetical protein WHT08_00945 [Bryobacteraceae bacterium]
MVRPAIEAREAVWRELVAKSLAWQPGGGTEGNRRPPLVLSSPLEWTAEQWKDAALHVLQVEAELRKSGWTLGSAAPQWVQFCGCRPVWISQTALHPRRPGTWEAEQQFRRELLAPLLERCGAKTGRLPWRVFLETTWRRVARLALAAPDDLGWLREQVDRLAPRRRWSPWKCCESAREPSGLASVLVKEAAARLGARLVYEWRGSRPLCQPLRPANGMAWVRFHQSEEEAAADYLDQRAVHGEVLPLWNRTGDPMQACPHRTPADLAVAVGRGNVPCAPTELALFTRQLSRMAPVAMVEFIPERGGVEWESFLGAVRGLFRVTSVVETGAGRRLCTLLRS